MAIGNTAIWRVRPSGSNTNGGGYDPGIAGAATDYSQQNAAQATGTNGSGVTTTTFTDTTANAFTSAMIGNCINITGQGFYFVTAFLTAGTVTVDRALGTFSGATWNLGGGWADFWTNTTTTANGGAAPALLPGNICYILGSGTPNPASYTYDYTGPGGAGTSILLAAGDTTNGHITFANDPQTPGYKAPPDTTGGMPVIKHACTSVVFFKPNKNKFAGLWFVYGASNADMCQAVGNGYVVIGCVVDILTFIPGNFVFGTSGFTTLFYGCEFFSSSTPSVATKTFISVGQAVMHSCNMHDIAIAGVAGTNGSAFITNCIFSNITNKTALAPSGGSGSGRIYIIANNTFDACGTGLSIPQQDTLTASTIVNNIFSNCTTVGIAIAAGTTAQNNASQAFADYNVFYNNLANYTAISAGPHDTAPGVTPYVGSATENYTLA